VHLDQTEKLFLLSRSYQGERELQTQSTWRGDSPWREVFKAYYLGERIHMGGPSEGGQSNGGMGLHIYIVLKKGGKQGVLSEEEILKKVR